MPLPRFDFVVLDSVVIGIFVGISLALSQLLQFERAYWVLVSCLAVIQGQSLRAGWKKQTQRILGTCVGLLLAWGFVAAATGQVEYFADDHDLGFVIEMVVVRHYGIAVIFITPLTILLIEAASFRQATVSALVEARFFDTVVGCAVGLVGGVCLHSPRFRTTFERWLRR